MTYIDDIPDGPHRERIRQEILENVSTRGEDEQNAFSTLTTYLGIIYSGSVIAIVSFIAQVKDGIPSLAVWSLVCFSIALLSFAALLYKHYQLHVIRARAYEDVAQRFFQRQATLADNLATLQAGGSYWLYVFLFWLPFSFEVIGFIFGILAVFGFGPKTNPFN